jgi:flagellar protein FliJ
MSQPAGQLGIVLRLRLEEERRAAAALRDAQARLEEEERRLAAIEAYAGEYTPGEHGGAQCARGLRDRRLFVARLVHTREAQQQQVQLARQGLEAARALWLAARLQREAIERLNERRRGEQGREQLRREQRLQDELALQAAARVAAGLVH